MKIISRQEPAEWVYIVCRNDQTHQETHVKLSAECFYPSPAGITFRRFVQKMGAPFARFPKHFSRSDNRSGFKLLFNCFGWC
jgi:hypothetical protein